MNYIPTTPLLLILSAIALTAILTAHWIKYPDLWQRRCSYAKWLFNSTSIPYVVISGIVFFIIANGLRGLL